MAKPRTRTFGTIRQRQPSKRWQALYWGPDGKRYTARNKAGVPCTFDTKGRADAALRTEGAAIDAGTWLSPEAQEAAALVAVTRAEAAVLTFGTYAERWLENRRLADRTRGEYRSLLDNRILPTFGERELAAITSAEVEAWRKAQPSTTPTRTAAAVALLRTILGTAERWGAVAVSPARKADDEPERPRRAKEIKPATLPQLEALAAAMPEPYRLLVLFLAWNAVRYGEATELRREDIEIRTVKAKDGTETKLGTIRVERGVVKLKGSRKIKDPKSEAGRRTVHCPPHLIPMLEHHLEHVAKGGLLFPSPEDPTKHLAHSTFHRWFTAAREAAGRPDLRPHDLRHTGAVLAAQTGATLAELMSRLGHSTVAAALRYQHAGADRDQAIAAALSRMVEAQ